jgi:hypothetical protein
MIWSIAHWSEAIAVGAPDWLQASAQKLGLKQYAVKNEKLEAKNHYIYYLAGKN